MVRAAWTMASTLYSWISMTELVMTRSSPSDSAAASGGAPVVIVCGSLAIDVIGYYAGTLQPASAAGTFSQSVQLDRLHVEFGGCAMNIAYTLALLGAQAFPVVRVGRDFRGDYAAHLRASGVSDRGVLVDEAFASSSHCIVLSDRDGNQLTAFYPGSSAATATGAQPHHDAGALAAAVGAQIAVIAPDVSASMIRHAERLGAAAIPYITDPGQGLFDFTPEAAGALVARSRRLILNDREWDTLLTMLGRTAAAVRAELDWLVVTQGARGLRAWQGDDEFHLPAIAARIAVDHTGCGDALRAGLTLGLASGASLVDALRIGVLCATYNLESQGCQRHRFSLDELRQRYVDCWRTPWPLDT